MTDPKNYKTDYTYGLERISALTDKTRTGDGGHIPGRYQWEETVDVSAGDDDD